MGSLFGLNSEFQDALNFHNENENNQSGRANMANPAHQSDAARSANERGETFGSRLSAGSPHLGPFGLTTADAIPNAKAAQYQILRLFTTTFDPDVIPSDERPLVAMHWVHSLKRHLTPLNEIPSAQMLVFIYTLLRGSADIASFKLTQRTNLTVAEFFEWFESRYCESSYGVSILDELQNLKQTGSLQEYIATATQLQAYNDFTPTPVTDKVFREYFIRGLQNSALQYQLRKVRLSSEEIARGEEIPEIMKEAERLVREGVYQECITAKPNASTNQNRPNVQNKGPTPYGLNRNNAVPQTFVQQGYPKVPFGGQQQYAANVPQFGSSGQHFRNQGQNGTSFQRTGQLAYKPPHLRANQSGQPSYQQPYQRAQPAQQNLFAPKTALRNYDPFGNQRNAPESDDMQLDALSFANPFAPMYAPHEYYEYHPGYAGVSYGQPEYYGGMQQPEQYAVYHNPESIEQHETSDSQPTVEYPKAEGQQ